MRALASTDEKRATILKVASPGEPASGIAEASPSIVK